MTRLDRLVIVLAVSLLAAIGGAIGSVPVAGRVEATPSFPPLPTPAPPRLVREGLVGTITSLDPLEVQTPAERSVSALLSCGLTRLGPRDELLPDLASDWDVTDDGATYTFHLRHDIRWHDGQPVTATDVVFTVLAIQDRSYQGPLRGRWDRVIAQWVDRWTVRFALGRPLAAFLPLTTQALIPEHILGPVPAAERGTLPFARHPVGCGLFRLGPDRTDGVELGRAGSEAPTGAGAAVAGSGPAPGWDPLGPLPEPTPSPADPRRPVIDGFRFWLYPDETALERAFTSGALDAAANLSSSLAGRLGSLPGISAIRYPTPTLTALLPNLRFDHRRLQEPGVRRALLLAIDREALVRDELGGAATLAQAPIPPDSSLFDAAAAGDVPYDPDAAARSLVLAGWTPALAGWIEPGFDTPQPIQLVTVENPQRPELRALADAVAAAWQAIGLQVRVEALPADELIARRLRPGEFDVALLDVDLGLDPDLWPLLSSPQAVEGGSNLSGYQSSVTDALLAAARLPADPVTRRQRFTALERRLAEQLPILPVAFVDRVFLVRDGLMGVAPRLIRDASDRYWDVLSWRLAGTPGR